MNSRRPQEHWLRRPESIRKLWAIGLAVLFGLVMLDFAIHPHAYFGIDGSFGFNSWFGFFTCVAMVVIAKLLGIFLKRRDTYYERD